MKAKKMELCEFCGYAKVERYEMPDGSIYKMIQAERCPIGKMIRCRTGRRGFYMDKDPGLLCMDGKPLYEFVKITDMEKVE